MPYVVPRASGRSPRLGCGPCSTGLGALPVMRNTLRLVNNRPARIGPPSSPISPVWGGNPPTVGPFYTEPATAASNGYNSGSSIQQANRRARRTQRQQQSNTKVNTTGAPSTIQSYDKYGNPIYTVPPPNQPVTGYDAAGNPLYAASSGSQPAGLQTSAITAYDAAGTPIYNTPPPGQTVVGVDSYGNPIYSGSAAASSLLTSSAAAVPAAAVPATESSYQSVLDWLSESTLISGLPNWGVAAGIAAAIMLIQSRAGGRR
jgi:hypothetical protein